VSGKRGEGGRDKVGERRRRWMGSEKGQRREVGEGGWGLGWGVSE